MTSIKQQKAAMCDTICSIITDQLDNANPEERGEIVTGLLDRFTWGMSLPQLQAWHYVIQQEVEIQDGS